MYMVYKLKSLFRSTVKPNAFFQKYQRVSGNKPLAWSSVVLHYVCKCMSRNKFHTFDAFHVFISCRHARHTQAISWWQNNNVSSLNNYSQIVVSQTKSEWRKYTNYVLFLIDKIYMRHTQFMQHRGDIIRLRIRTCRVRRVVGQLRGEGLGYSGQDTGRKGGI